MQLYMWHQYNKINELLGSFYVLLFIVAGAYTTASQQMLEMSTTFSKTSVNLLYCVTCDRANCSWVISGNSLFDNVFHFLQASWVILKDSFFEKSPQKSGSGRSGDQGGQRSRLTWSLPRTLTINSAVAMFALWTVAPSCWKEQSFPFFLREKWIETEDSYNFPH